MKVKELKELLKDQPDDLEVIFGRLDENYENYYTEVKMYKTEPVNVETKIRALLLYNKEDVCFENLQPNIIN